MTLKHNQHKVEKSIKALSFLMLGVTKQERLRIRIERSTSLTADNQLCADNYGQQTRSNQFIIDERLGSVVSCSTQSSAGTLNHHKGSRREAHETQEQCILSLFSQRAFAGLMSFGLPINPSTHAFFHGWLFYRQYNSGTRNNFERQPFHAQGRDRR